MIPSPRTARPAKRAGFTLVEVMLATTIAMILLFGALYSTGETVDLVQEGDVAVNTNMHGRRMLERFLKDCRYSSALDVTGSATAGWTIDVTTTGTLDPGDLTYEWSPDTGQFTVSDGATVDVLLTDLRDFAVETSTADIGGQTVITRMTVQWVLGLDDGRLTGVGGADAERTLELAGTTWIRKNDG